MTLALLSEPAVDVWVARLPGGVEPRAGSHAVLEDVLARYAPGARVSCRPGRPPAVMGAALAISLSRTRELALVGVSRGSSVGVDVEAIADAPPPSVVRELFTASEASALPRLCPGEQGRGYSRAWARKEAVLKALGVGLALDTRAIDVGVDAAPRRVVDSPAGPVAVCDLELGDHVGAVATTGGAPPEIRVRLLEPVDAERSHRGSGHRYRSRSYRSTYSPAGVDPSV